MNIFVVLGIIWIAVVGYFMIKKQGERGGVILAFLILAGLLWASSERFGFNGGIAAVVLAALFTVGIIIYDKKNKS